MSHLLQLQHEFKEELVVVTACFDNTDMAADSILQQLNMTVPNYLAGQDLIPYKNDAEYDMVTGLLPCAVIYDSNGQIAGVLGAEESPEKVRASVETQIRISMESRKRKKIAIEENEV